MLNILHTHKLFHLSAMRINSVIAIVSINLHGNLITNDWLHNIPMVLAYSSTTTSMKTLFASKKFLQHPYFLPNVILEGTIAALKPSIWFCLWPSKQKRH